MRPARYSVLPARMPSLKGSAGLASGRWMARRPDCAGACENAPRTVTNPAATSTKNTKPALRFSADLLLLTMVSSVVPVPWGYAGKIGARVYSALVQDASGRGQGDATPGGAACFSGASLRSAGRETSATIFAVLALLIAQLRS